MNKIFIILAVILYTSNMAAHTNDEKVIKENLVLVQTDCGSVYNATLAFMKRRFSIDVAQSVANAAANACYDENEKELGLNPGCQ